MFDGNPVHWSEFIGNFYDRIHKKSLFNDSVRIDHLLTSLDGEAKTSVKQSGPTVIFTLRH